MVKWQRSVVHRSRGTGIGAKPFLPVLGGPFWHGRLLTPCICIGVTLDRSNRRQGCHWKSVLETPLLLGVCLLWREVLVRKGRLQTLTLWAAELLLLLLLYEALLVLVTLLLQLLL